MQTIIILEKMERQLSAWGRSNKGMNGREGALDWLWIGTFLLAALLLFCLNLGSLPLGEGNEGILAQSAREIWQSSWNSQQWLFPTLWGEPYLEHPPLVQNMMALAYSLGGGSEWSSRFPSALLSALSVPLLYSVSREVFPFRLSAIFSTLIYLTWFPVVEQGRFAGLTGPLLFFELFMFWCVLRSRRDLRWGLGIGIGLGLLGLTKGLAGLFPGAIALLFLAWDTPRLLTSAYLWVGIALGSAPLVAWYVAQWFYYGEEFFLNHFLPQLLPVSEINLSLFPGDVFVEAVQFVFPWLIFCLYGLWFAKNNLAWSWAKFVVVWSSFYLIVVAFGMVQLPWSIFSLYPALALAGGAKLSEVAYLNADSDYPKLWTAVLSMFAIAAITASVHFGLTYPENFPGILILTAVSITMVVAAFLSQRRDAQFIFILFWGGYLSLLLLVSFPPLLWQGQSPDSVKPVAELIRNSQLPSSETIYTSFASERPALNFYSERRILPPPSEAVETIKNNWLGQKGDYEPNPSQQELQQAWLKHYWESTPQPYLLLETHLLEKLNLESIHQIGSVNSWVLVTKQPH